MEKENYFFCRTQQVIPSGQDNVILPAQVANLFHIMELSQIIMSCVLHPLLIINGVSDFFNMLLRSVFGVEELNGREITSVFLPACGHQH